MSPDFVSGASWGVVLSIGAYLYARTCREVAHYVTRTRTGNYTAYAATAFLGLLGGAAIGETFAPALPWPQQMTTAVPALFVAALLVIDRARWQRRTLRPWS